MLLARLIRSPIALQCAAAASPPVWCAVRCSQSRSPAAKRASRRRYAASNTRGRISQAKDLLKILKDKPEAEAKAFYEALHPRDKLDIERLRYEKRVKRRGDRASSSLPKYYSVPFEKRYFFREEDVVEESTLGRGPGGQATNRRMQTAIVRHAPSGIIVKFSRFPSLWLNRRAARELLHLRLEEHLIGPASRLGRARAARELRQRRRERTVAYLAKKGDRLQSREAKLCRWAEFLEGAAPLPEPAVQQMGMQGSPGPVTLDTLFGSECGRWWPKLVRAVAASAAAGGGCAESTIPVLLRHLFPATYGTASPSEVAALRRCGESEAARASVARAVECFCELFGLRLRGGAAAAAGTRGVAAASQRCQLQRDGLNWVQHHTRMYGEEGNLTLEARVCWPHVYLSLRQLGMDAEARAIVVFFKREAKAAKDAAAQPWPQEALRCLSVALREGTGAAERPTEADAAATRVEHPATA